MKIPVKVYDWIYWISIVVVLLWMVLKATGVINSPVWQELLPFAGGVVAVIAYFQKVGRSLQKIEHMDSDLREFKAEIKADLRDFKFEFKDFRKEVTGELHQHNTRLMRIEAKLA